MRHSLVCILLIGLPLSAHAQRKTVTPTAGMVITESVRLKGDTYLLPSPSGDLWQGAITVRGDNLTVDFKDVELRGTATDVLPDQRKGTAIVVEGRNVTIKNVEARGYKVGLAARNAPGLKVLDSDFSYNWKPRTAASGLKPTLNPQDEWLSKGAGVYLRSSDGFEIKNVRVTGGHCGLMVTDCDNGLVWNSDVSFLNGVGIALHESSSNRIMHNRIDWCVGNDKAKLDANVSSAGIFVSGPSSRNNFAFNSVTHGAEGLAIFTLDGRPTHRQDFIYGNDISYSLGVGVRTTGTQNRIAHNLLQECSRGIWASGLSESLILGNQFLNCREGIAFDAGRANTVQGNSFVLGRTSIRVGPYKQNGKQLDSPDHLIEKNFFSRPQLAIAIQTTKARIVNNQFQLADRVLDVERPAEGLAFDGNTLNAIPQDRVGFSGGTTNRLLPNVELGLVPEWDPYATRGISEEVKKLRPVPLKGRKDVFATSSAPSGRMNILVDDWGPYDFRYPRLWPESVRTQTVEEAGRVPTQAREKVQRFRVLGPPGTWRLVRHEGVLSIAPEMGDVPGVLEVTLPVDAKGEMILEMEYSGEATVDFLGNRTPKGRPVLFTYRSRLN